MDCGELVWEAYERSVLYSLLEIVYSETSTDTADGGGTSVGNWELTSKVKMSKIRMKLNF